MEGNRVGGSSLRNEKSRRKRWCRRQAQLPRDASRRGREAKRCRGAGRHACMGTLKIRRAATSALARHTVSSPRVTRRILVAESLSPWWN
eukprot:364586-Chlamydomonas_euryale.AAC.18